MSSLAAPSGANTMKCVVIGDAGAGKTTLVRRMQFGVFTAGLRTTVGVEFAQKALVVDGANVTVRLWDVAGQESARNASRTYYQGALGAIIVVDATNPLSLDATLRWKADLDEKTMASRYSLVTRTQDGTPFADNARRLPCYLLLNKCDLGVSIGKTAAELEALCARHGICGVFETSAVTGQNVTNALEALVRVMLRVSATSDLDETKNGGGPGGGGGGGESRGSDQARGTSRIVLTDDRHAKPPSSCPC